MLELFGTRTAVGNGHCGACRGSYLSKREESGRGTNSKGGTRVCLLLCLPQTLVALRRVKALQQHRPEAVQNTSVDTSEEQKDEKGYTEHDRKILQLCGENQIGWIYRT